MAIDIRSTTNIVYKTLGFKLLLQAFCPASAFVSADSDAATQSPTFHTAKRYPNIKNKKNG